VISIEKPGSPEEILEHVGVKGMRWGVRKSYPMSVGNFPKNKTQVKNVVVNTKNLNKVLVTKTPKATGNVIKK
jgi:adenosine/AMP kinase